MSSIASVPGISPRPKIHRLPAFASPPPAKPSRAGRLFIGWGALLAVGVFLALLAQHEMAVFSAVHEAREGSVAALAPEQVKRISWTAAGQGKSIVLKDKSAFIVGQLAKIPTESEQITEIKPLSDIDNHAGHELLSIISKY